VTGSFNFQYRFGASIGAWLVTSSFVVNSGGSVFDALAYGNVTDFGFTAVISNGATVLIQAEPLR